MDEKPMSFYKWKQREVTRRRNVPSYEAAWRERRRKNERNHKFLIGYYEYKLDLLDEF